MRPAVRARLSIEVRSALARSTGVSVTQVAVAHTFGKPAVTSLIVVARRGLARRA